MTTYLIVILNNNHVSRTTTADAVLRQVETAVPEVKVKTASTKVYF